MKRQRRVFKFVVNLVKVVGKHSSTGQSLTSWGRYQGVVERHELNTKKSGPNHLMALCPIPILSIK